MPNHPKILLATTNAGKLHEITDLLADLPAHLVTPKELGLSVEVGETGTTYLENAKLKALAFASASGLVSIGDDSGLEVDALDGAPGVYTARYAGPGATDSDRYHLLLRNLDGVPAERRTARFRCVVGVATPDGHCEAAEGVCEGRIAAQPVGENGFGYDPVFHVDTYGRTMAELPDSIKNTISHRARAFQAAQPLILAALRRWAG
jgi:XTP/dITP diphosphohydrolase